MQVRVVPALAGLRPTYNDPCLTRNLRELSAYSVTAAWPRPERMPSSTTLIQVALGGPVHPAGAAWALAGNAAPSSPAITPAAMTGMESAAARARLGKLMRSVPAVVRW